MIGSTGRRPMKKRLNEYTDEVTRAQKWRRDQGYDNLWNKLRQMYSGELDLSTLSPETDVVAVNMAFSTINVMYPSVSGGTPKIEVKPNDPAKEVEALLVEDILNYTWEHWNFQYPFRRAAKDLLIFGHGWLKTGWKFVEEEQPRSVEEQAEEFLMLREQTEMAAAMNPEAAGSLPNDDEIARSLGTTKLTIVEDRPTLEYVSILDMYVNPEATSMDDIRWIAQRILRPLEEVKRDEDYEPVRKELGGTYMSFDHDDPRYEGLDTDRGKMVELWEFYDLVDGVMCIFVREKSGQFLVKPTKMPYVFGHPFEMMRNYDIPDMFYPMGDLEQLWPLQQELNKTRSDMMNFRAKYANKYLVRKKSLQRGDYEKLTSRTDGEVILVEDDQTPLDDVVRPMPINPLDAGLFSWSGQISSDIQEVSGVSEYARGTASGAQRTATEAALIQDALNARSGEKLAIVEGTVTRVARKTLQIMQQFLTGEQVARTFGAAGQMLWVEYDRESIRGEYDFAVEAGSTQPSNETFRRQSAIALMNTMMPFVQFGIIDPSQLVLHILREGFSIRNPEKFLSQGLPMGDPMAQQQAGGPPNPGTLPNMPGMGIDSPQPTPEDRREQAMAENEVPGVPPEIFNQLQNQNGVSPMI